MTVEIKKVNKSIKDPIFTSVKKVMAKRLKDVANSNPNRIAKFKKFYLDPKPEEYVIEPPTLIQGKLRTSFVSRPRSFIMTDAVVDQVTIDEILKDFEVSLKEEESKEDLIENIKSDEVRDAVVKYLKDNGVTVTKYGIVIPTASKSLKKIIDLFNDIDFKEYSLELFDTGIDKETMASGKLTITDINFPETTFDVFVIEDIKSVLPALMCNTKEVTALIDKTSEVVFSFNQPDMSGAVLTSDNVTITTGNNKDDKIYLYIPPSNAAEEVGNFNVKLGEEDVDFNVNIKRSKPNGNVITKSFKSLIKPSDAESTITVKLAMSNEDNDLVEAKLTLTNSEGKPTVVSSTNITKDGSYNKFEITFKVNIPAGVYNGKFEFKSKVRGALGNTYQATSFNDYKELIVENDFVPPVILYKLLTTTLKGYGNKTNVFELEFNKDLNGQTPTVTSSDVTVKAFGAKGTKAYIYVTPNIESPVHSKRDITLNIDVKEAGGETTKLTPVINYDSTDVFSYTLNVGTTEKLLDNELGGSINFYFSVDRKDNFKSSAFILKKGDTQIRMQPTGKGTDVLPSGVFTGYFDCKAPKDTYDLVFMLTDTLAHSETGFSVPVNIVQVNSGAVKPTNFLDKIEAVTKTASMTGNEPLVIEFTTPVSGAMKLTDTRTSKQVTYTAKSDKVINIDMKANGYPDKMTDVPIPFSLVDGIRKSEFTITINRVPETTEE